MARQKKQTPLAKEIDRLADWYKITPASVQTIYEEMCKAYASHNCDDHKVPSR